jgi:transketolase
MSHIHDSKIRELEIVANRVRRHVISMLAEAGSGHPAGALGMADVFVAMYFHVLHHDPKNPEWPERDRLILSNGHICPARYAAMAEAGYFPIEEMKSLRKIGSRLQGHPERLKLPGLETTSGPLGAGLAQSCGLALAAKMDNAKWRAYCLTSDGEHDCGLHWEAVMLAGARKLNNLTVIVDRNNIQLDGPTETIMPLEPLREKYESFGWHAIDINGNDIREVVEAVNQAKAVAEKPTVILAHTIPGRGVSFMEGDFKWHGTTPTKEEAEQAARELLEREKKIQEEG